MKTKNLSAFQKLSPEARLNVRKSAIQMLRHGSTHAEIILSLKISKSTLERTITAWRKGGQNALAEMDRRQGCGGGTPKILSPEQELLILSMIIDHTPDQYKSEAMLWSRDAVYQLIQDKLGIKIGQSTTGLYLKRWGLAVPRPARQVISQKSDHLKMWVEHELPAVKKEAKEKGAAIFFVAETAIRNIANSACEDSPKGPKSVTPASKKQAKRMHINMISAISPAGTMKFALRTNPVDSDTFIDFAAHLLRDTRRPIILLADNLRAHHSKKTQQWLKENNASISMHFLTSSPSDPDSGEGLNND